TLWSGPEYRPPGSEQVGSQLFGRTRGEQAGWHVEQGVGAIPALGGEPVGGAGVGDQHAGGEPWVVAEGEAELDQLPVPWAGLAAAQHETAVRHAGVVPGELLGGDEVHSRLIGLEVVR